jgi:hypothetical protein
MDTHAIKCTREPILGHFVQSTFFHPVRFQTAVGVHLGVFTVFGFFKPTLVSSFGTAYWPFAYWMPSCSWAIIVVSCHRGFWLDLGMHCTCFQILPYTLLYNILVTWILCFVDRASQYNCVKKTNLMHNLFLVYFANLYMFRVYLGPSSEGTTVCIQQLVLIILFRWLSVVLVTAKCCIHMVVPPDDGPRYARNM